MNWEEPQSRSRRSLIFHRVRSTDLNRIAGEPIDVLVNGKYVAKGEVVIIEESYGIRITDIVKIRIYLEKQQE